MISALKHAIAIAPTILFLLLLLPLGTLKSRAEQVLRIDDQQYQQLISQMQSDNQQHAGTLGHYAFEVAPNMVPPSVRKPPYSQSNHVCQGSKLNPHNTLCGDLNKGILPKNPIGQNVMGLTYPFEAIKNKTLQFLARALPILKEEYESIPKVVPHLPNYQLLNPTHIDSPLSSEQMHQLNQQFAPAFGQSEQFFSAPYYSRRRKRSVPGHNAKQAGGSIVAEQLSTTSLVVSSAHASGRIQPRQAGNSSRNDLKAAPDQVQTASLVTKDGHKPISPVHLTDTGAGHNRQQVGTQRTHNSADYLNGWAPNSAVHYSASKQVASQPGNVNHSQGGGAAQSSSTLGNGTGGAQQQKSSSQRTRNNEPNSDQDMRNQQRPPMVVASNDLTVLAPAERGADESSSTPLIEPVRRLPGNQEGGKVAGRSSGSSAAPSGGSSANQQAASGAGQQAKQEPARRRTPSCETGNTFATVICQAATMFIDSAGQQPSWFNVIKQIGSLYNGASESVASPSSSILTTLSGLAGLDSAQPVANSKSGSAASSTGAAIQNKNNNNSNLLSLLGPISNFLYGTSAKDSSSVASQASSSPSADGSVQNKEQQQVSSILSKVVLWGYAVNFAKSLFDQFGPQLTGSQSFARRKAKPYDLQESFLDTISSAAMLSASGRQSAPANSASQIGQPPPTPCNSNEEYISPTFARNYLGAWKYVVQIPKEGYFTQTISRTNCAQSGGRCNFTEGTCHEAPRWVSLLVAEIYYPNSVIGVQAMGAEQLGAAASTNSIQQQGRQQQQQQRQQVIQQQGQMQPKSSKDPLQMIDSLQSLYHNPQSGLLGNELTWDQNNALQMQQISEAYNNYQLFQRNGMLASQQQHQQLETRSSPSTGTALYSSANQPAQYSVQQHQLAGYPTQQQYIAALINDALLRDPGMSVNEFISSLSSQRRRKRDVAPMLRGQPQQRLNQHNQQPLVQSRSSSIELGPASMNDISASMNQMGLQQAPAQFKQPPAGSNQVAPAGVQQLPAQQVVSSTLMDQNQLGQLAAAQLGEATGSQMPTSGQTNGATDQPGNQVECDGHDKIGCYVVRVYYDWFLVNGSCKCWRTTANQAAGASGSSGGNSILRRIFTG